MRYVLISLLILAWQNAIAQELPELRPALVGRSPGAIINRIDEKTLVAAKQKDGLVMFYAVVRKTGDVGLNETYLGTPDSQLLQQEVQKALADAKMIPAVRNHEPVSVIFYGTVVFSMVDGKPRLRLFANQDANEIKAEHDFIAPQPCIGGDSGFEGIHAPAKQSPVPLDAVVSLQIAVDAAGNLQDAKVLEESPPLLGFGDAALTDFKEAKYIPAFRDGKPVASQTTFSVYYPSKE